MALIIFILIITIYIWSLYRPNESKIVPLRARDIIPPSRQIYELQLAYTFHSAKATEVTPNAALLSDLLYENEYESQMWMIYDSNKQLISCGDAYPSKVSILIQILKSLKVMINV